MSIIAKSTAAKLSVAVVAVAMLFAFSAPSAKAQTLEELQALIAQLQAQIAALTGGGGGGTCPVLTQPMTIGSQGPNVVALQNYLTSTGHFTFSGGSTGYFGPITQSAVAAWQAANGVAPAVGYWGPISLAKYNSVCTATAGGDSGGSVGSDDLEGGAGSVDTYTLSGEYSNEEVGEGANDQEVAQVDIEASDSSDIKITAVRLVFSDEGSTNNDDDFDEYADEVSIWLDGDEYGRDDADEWNDDNTYSHTMTLGNGAIVRAGDTGELVVAVSGINNLDGSSAGDSWDVDFRSVRFMDAQGVSISEDPSTDPVVFTFETFATSQDVEFKISKGDDEINDARTIEVSSSSTTDIDILSFEVEIEGDSDVNWDDARFNIDTTEESNGDFDDPGDVIQTATLYMNGEKVGSETVSDDGTGDDDTNVDFDNMDIDLEAGETYEFTLSVKIPALGTTLKAGDTIQARITETETDSSAFDAEDETGENLADADKTGAAIADAHTVRSTGFVFDLVSTSAKITTTGDPSASPATDDQGTFTIKYELAAFGGDVSIDKSCTEAQVDAADQGVEFTITNTASSGTNCTVSSTADTNSDDSDAWLLEENTTETFTLTVTATASADHFAKVYLTSINWDDNTDDTSPDLFETTGLGEDKTSTDELFLNDY